MSQTKKGSIIEVLINILIGYVVAVTAQAFIFPFFGFHATIKENLTIGLFFTVVSIVRSYLLRRLFNRLRCFETKEERGV